MKVQHLVLFFLIFVFSVNAIEKEIVVANLETLKDGYNANIDKVPSIIRSLFGNERVNIYIDDMIFGVDMKNGIMQNIKEGKIEYPTMNVYTSEETVLKLVNEEITIQEALNKRLVKYNAVRFTGKIKYGIVNAGLRVSNWFM